jgi:hypothetical protein
MTTVTVFRHPPPPVIGVCGVVLDRASETFEQSLDWLEATGILYGVSLRLPPRNHLI